MNNTLNIDIFVCIHFRGFMKMGNFAWIKIRSLRKTPSIGYHKRKFRSVYIFSRISKKRELRENIYSVKISTFTVNKKGKMNAR